MAMKHSISASQEKVAAVVGSGAQHSGSSAGVSKFDGRPFFAPESVAVIGASKAPWKAGHIVLRNLVECGFEGALYPVNPSQETILGLQSHPSIGAIPEPVETAIIVTPSHTVPRIVEECGEKGVEALIIDSGGFSEGGETGAALEEAVLTTARRYGMRIVGPNTTGIFNADAKFTSTFMGLHEMRTGSVGFIAQTGMFLGFVLEKIYSQESFAFSKVAGLGNKIDVDDADMLSYLGADPDLDVIAVYIEGLKDGRRFLDAARSVTAHKPVVAFKSGTSSVGKRAAQSHTSALACDDRVFIGAAHQAGIVRAHSITDLLKLAKAFAFQPIPDGSRVGIVSVTGAGCVIAADACAREGLGVATLSDETLETIATVTPSWHHVDNPVDIWPACERSGPVEAHNIVLEALLADEGVDAVVLFAGIVTTMPVDFEEFSIFHRDTAPSKPVISAMMGHRSIKTEAKELFEARRFPVYDDISDAVHILAKLVEYGAYRRHLQS